MPKRPQNKRKGAEVIRDEFWGGAPLLPSTSGTSPTHVLPRPVHEPGFQGGGEEGWLDGQAGDKLSETYKDGVDLQSAAADDSA